MNLNWNFLKLVSVLGGLLAEAGEVLFFGGCVQHQMVACGELHAAIDPVTAPWDVVALVPCVHEAGGIASTLEGDEAHVIFGGSRVTAANPALLRALLTHLGEAP